MRVKDGKTIPELVEAVYSGLHEIDELPSGVRNLVAKGVSALVEAAEAKAAATKKKKKKKEKK